MGSTTEDLLDRAAPDLDEAAVRAEFDAAMAADGRLLPKIAPEVGIPYGTLSSWKGGTYKGDNQRIARAVNAWLISREARARARAVLPHEPPFVMTQTASRIWEVLEFAKTTPTIGVIVGNAGVGKTLALKGYTGRYPQNVLAGHDDAVPHWDFLCAGRDRIDHEPGDGRAHGRPLYPHRRQAEGHGGSSGGG